MSKRVRDSLLIIFIILFIALSLVTSLFASGYKFHLTWPLQFNRLLVKTGTLAVSSKPGRAQIFLNNKEQKLFSLNPWDKNYITTPGKIKNLIPDEYVLEVALPDYWPYEQRVTIYPGETSFVENITLFKQSAPLLVAPEATKTSLLLSPDSKYLYSQAGNLIIDLKTLDSRDFTPLLETAFPPSYQSAPFRETPENPNPSSTYPAQWLRTNKLFKSGLVIDPKEAADLNYLEVIGPGTDWHYDEASNYLYYRHNLTINRFSLSQASSEVIASGEKYLDYLPQADKLMVIVAEEDLKLRVLSLKTYESLGDWLLPKNAHYRFVANPYYLALYDELNQSLLLFNSNNFQASPVVINQIKAWDFVNSNLLLYTDGYEISLLDISSQDRQLITRLSTAIDSLIWHSSGHYFIFNNKQSLNIYNFKNNQITTLLTAQEIASPLLLAKQKLIYFWANLDEQAGVYKISL
ncbi:MAG: hypothetical protein ACOX0C_03250 [Patescibacteria group bacterium]|jgi:hypothetical protein